MNKLKNVLLVSGIVASSIATTSVLAEGVTFLPLAKEGYKPEAAVSLIGGVMEPTDSNADSSSILGAELSFRCVLLQVGDNQLRQQLSYTTWEKNNLKLQNIELNAHYQMPVANDLKIGVGPGVGIIMTDLSGSDNPTFFGAQLGASAHYTGLGPIFLGAEARYQITNKDKFVSGAEEDNMNNWRVAAKVGYIF